MGGINIEVLKCDKVQENVAKMIFFFFAFLFGLSFSLWNVGCEHSKLYG